MNNHILDFCEKKGIEIVCDADISAITSIKCGAKARFLAEPDTRSKLVDLVSFLRHKEIDYRVVGGMTNTLPPSGDFEGVLIRTRRIGRLSFTENNRVYAEAGASLSETARRASMRGIGGFAELVGIPGTIGGAIFGNAGAHGRAMSDIVLSAIVYDPENNNIQAISGGDLNFGYRDSVFRRVPRYLILEAELCGETADKEMLVSQMREYTEIRRIRQPISMPSLGSIFKHPTGDFAPRIIDELGLKGLSVGGAVVSEKHAGFIVNSGSATPEDIKKLIKIIKDEVFRARGILLEEEINVM